MENRILIIEDEKQIVRFLELELKYEGYLIDIAYDGREGLNKALTNSYDLVILDIMLPLLNGIEVLRRIRQVSEVPIIMLTAKDDITDKVMGLDVGADDYITKPFAIEELLARIRANLRRKNGKNTNPAKMITVEDLTIDLAKREVKRAGKLIDLTKKEFELLEYLLKNKDLVVTREQILEKVWGYDFFGDTHVVDVYIRYLRSKIDDEFAVKLIETVRGIGYIIKGER